MQLRMLRHVRLDEHGAALGIKPGGKPVEKHFNRVLLYLGCIGVIRSEGMPVGDEEEALVLVLHAYPVIERADIIAEVQFAGGAHAAEDAFSCSRSGHALSTSKNIPRTGAMSLPKRPGAK